MSYYLCKPPLITQGCLETYFLFFQTQILQKLFFSSVIIEWNNLDKSVWNLESFSFCKKSILKFIRPSPNSTHNCFDTKGIKHLITSWLKHAFLDSLNQICSCGFDIKATCHFLLYWPNFINQRSLLLNNVSRLTKDKLPLVTLQLSNFSFMVISLYQARDLMLHFYRIIYTL